MGCQHGTSQYRFANEPTKPANQCSIRALVGLLLDVFQSGVLPSGWELQEFCLNLWPASRGGPQARVGRTFREQGVGFRVIIYRPRFQKPVCEGMIVSLALAVSRMRWGTEILTERPLLLAGAMSCSDCSGLEFMFL